MPLINQSSYAPPWWLKNAHLATIIPSIFRKVEGVRYTRERITTPDNDFMDLDWVKDGSKKLLLLSHGLEGSSDRHYMMGPAKLFAQKGWDVVAWNCRTCSGEINRQPRLYHHAATDDLDTVVQHINNTCEYTEIVMAGFSMGGSLILNYLGQGKFNVPNNIKKTACFSVPCNLGASARQLSRPGRGFYRKRFLKKLGLKMKAKAQQFPDLISVDGYHEVDSFPKFEERYTAPIHGFKNADHFYNVASCEHYLSEIKIPVLIVNALNDPFFSEECYPIAQAEKSANVFLETPKYGGHVGFSLAKGEYNWMELRMLEFFGQN